METQKPEPGHDDSHEQEAYERAEQGDTDSGPASTPEEHDQLEERDQAEG